MADTEHIVHHPNRELPESKQTRAIVVTILLASAALMAVVTFAGWSVLAGMNLVQVIFIAVYVRFAVLVAGWSRGSLAMAIALSLILIIFAAVAAPEWFNRDKSGFESPLLPETLLGMLTLSIIPLQLLLIAFGLRGLKQEWNVEA